MHRVPIVLLLALLVSLVAPLGAFAQGVIVVDPPRCDPVCRDPVLIAEQLTVRSHRVDVSIADQVATTRIDQVFHNPNSWVAEGTYIFPLSPGAAISDFTMTVDGEPIEARLLDAEEARRIYDEIVRNLRDPALLEYIGKGAIQASVFPIPPGEDRRIEIAYGEIIPSESGLSRYRYPLSTEKFSAQPLEQVSVRVEVETAEPLRAVYSPSHDVAIDRDDDLHFVAGFEDSDVRPAADFELFWSVSPDAIGASVVSHIDSEGQGHFLLLAAPGIDDNTEIVAKDVIIVLDTSGSMEGEKIAQAKDALLYVLGHLNPDDRFTVVEFSTGAREFADELLPPAEAERAAQWVQDLEATGGTDINLALLEALAMAEFERPTMVLFLTDGLPTEGEVEIPRIIDNVADAAPENVRLFAFGVGDDVDAILLDTLSSEHQGRTTYVRPGEALNEAVSGFYAGITAPVLADLEIDVSGVDVAEIYPNPLPDLFAGSQLIALGTYEDGGEATLTLSGEVNGTPREFTYGVSFADDAGSEFLPRLWATRKIGYLINQIRLHGENEELIDAIVDISLQYGIVTPYTSYLITEDDILSQEAQARAATAIYDSSAAAPASGADAVTMAQEARAIADASGPMATVTVENDEGEEVSSDEVLRYAADRAFVLRDGVWIDTGFDPEQTTTVVPFAGDAYFAVLEAHPELGPAFALGRQVIVVVGETVYEVTDEA